MYKIYFLVILIVLVTSCNSAKNDVTDRLIGEYNFTMYDSLDLMLMEGDFTIMEIEDNNVTGSYLIKKLMVEDLPASPSLNSRKYTGTLINKKLSVNLNPKMADNNIFLTMDVYKDSLSGTWSHSTFVGEKNKGRIKAVKKF